MRVVILLLTLGITHWCNAQVNASKRDFTNAELKQLTQYSDSIQQELKRLYKAELKENSPGKYQPQRLALVRSYLWIFDYLEHQRSVVAITSKQTEKILGHPDAHYQSGKYLVFQYKGLNKPYLKLKNMEYQFWFHSNQLIEIKSTIK